MWIRYKTLTTDVAYTTTWVDHLSMREIPRVMRISDTGLRRGMVMKVLGTRRTWRVLFGADALGGGASGWTTIKAVWSAAIVEINTTSYGNGTPPVSNWIVCAFEDGGDLPLEFVDDVDVLRSVVLTFIEKTAS